MAAQISALIGVMERIAPRRLALDWDREHIGLAVGSPEESVERVLVGLDPTLEAVAQARAAGAGLLITHHPLLFRPLTAVRTDRPAGNVVAAALAGGVALFSAHTNLDVAEGGVSDVLAGLLGLEELEPLQVTARESLVKLVVFVPESHVDQVRQALGEAGAGHLGRYSHCTFSAPGTGTFLPEEGTHPYLGRPGTLARVAEARVETILPEDHLPTALRKVREVHPYEEIAYDVYPLRNEGKIWGLGRIGRLPGEQSLGQLLEKVGKALGVPDVSYVGDPGRCLRKVAVCGGSAGDLVLQAVFRGADVLVAGEIKYHDGLLARQEGLAVIAAGHDATERPVVPVLARRLREETERQGLAVEVLEAPAGQGLWRTAHLGQTPGELTIYTDGAARGNPGPAGLGYLIYDAGGRLLTQGAEYLGETTNNVAEYKALIRALEEAAAFGPGPVRVFSDSELMVRQLNGEYAVRQPHLAALHAEAQRLLAGFAGWSARHVPREKNKEADRLSNEGIDRHFAGATGGPVTP